jgi:hypothetical protein
VVDRARLESGSTFTGTGSSNLPLSATTNKQLWDTPALRHSAHSVATHRQSSDDGCRRLVTDNKSGLEKFDLFRRELAYESGFSKRTHRKSGWRLGSIRSSAVRNIGEPQEVSQAPDHWDHLGNVQGVSGRDQVHMRVREHLARRHSDRLSRADDRRRIRFLKFARLRPPASRARPTLRRTT